MASERLRDHVAAMDDETLGAVLRGVRQAEGADAAVKTRGSDAFVIFRSADESTSGVVWVLSDQVPTAERLAKFPSLVAALDVDAGIVANATGEAIGGAVPDGIEYLDLDDIVTAIESAGLTEDALATRGVDPTPDTDDASDQREQPLASDDEQSERGESEGSDGPPDGPGGPAEERSGRGDAETPDESDGQTEERPEGNNRSDGPSGREERRRGQPGDSDRQDELPPGGRRSPADTGQAESFDVIDQLRRFALPLVVLVLVVGGAAAAGTLGLGPLSGGERHADSGPAVASGSIPADVDFVLAVDGNLTDDAETRALVNTALSDANTRFDSLSAGLDRLGVDWDIDPTGIDRAVAFGRQSATSQYAAVRLRLSGSASAASVAETIAADAVTQSTHAGVTVYRIGSERTDATEQWVASPADGTMLIGDAPAVEDALSVRNGTGPAWRGDLRDRFEAIQSGSIRLVTRLPDEQQEFDALAGIETLTAAYTPRDSKVSLRARLYAESWATARNVTTDVEETISSMQQALRDSTAYVAAVDVLTAATVRTDGSTIVVETTTGPESAGTLAQIALQTVGVFQTNARVTETPTQPTDGVADVNAVGTDIENGTVGSVNVTVKLATGAEPVDLGAITATWAAGGTSRTLTAGDPAGADGRFAVTVLRDDDESIRQSQTLDTASDRAQLHFSPGTVFGERLEAGETVHLEITTQRGETTTVTLTVPDSLSGKQAVSL